MAFVAIGRNEGERLKRCLTSLRRVSERLVYVDSGSTDDSVEFATGLGVEVVDLDTSSGFSMARGRNAGWRRVLELHPDTEFIHFIDGDCELVEGWLARALSFAIERPDVAAFCGRRRERFPEVSVYNFLCEIEWNTPPGEAMASGGDVLMRVAPFASVGGFNESLIAFEEPELCRRLRNAGWKIWRIDADTTLHDAAITRFSQWWTRHERAGYGAAVVTALCAGEGDAAGASYFGGYLRSSRIWLLSVSVTLFAGVPAAWLAIGPVGASGLLVALIGLILFQSLRIALGVRSRTPDCKVCLAYGIFTMIAKFPQALGQIRYLQDKARGAKAALIEYK